MEKEVRELIGSETRDIVRWAHKEIFSSSCYASDLDLALISPEEAPTPEITLVLLSKKGVLAFIEYKTKFDEKITWSEEIFYNDLDSKGYLIYIVRGQIHTTWKGESIFKMIKTKFRKNSISSPSKGEILGILREDFQKFKVYQYIKQNNGFTEKFEGEDFIKWELEMRKKGDEIIKYRNEHYGGIKGGKIVKVVCVNCGFILDVSESEIISNTIIRKCPICPSNAFAELEGWKEFQRKHEEEKRYYEEETSKIYKENKEV